MEGLSHNYESISHNEGIKEQNIPSFNDVENNIKQNYENNLSKEGSNNLALKQLKEQQQLKEQKESPILQEAREGLNQQAMINEAKTMLYEKLGINDNLGNNNWGENFGKGLVDTLILDNYDLAIQVWETNGAVIIDGIKQLFSSWENIKKVAEALGESVMGLFSLDGYQTGKSIAELGLIGSGVGAGVYVGKRTVKLGMKQILKLRKSAERVVESSKTKQVIGKTVSKVDEIVPKKEVDIEALAKKRVDIKEKIEGLEKLGIPESISRDMLESGLLNEKFYGGDLLKRFDALENKGIDYNALLDDVIKQIPNLTREEALLIFTYTDNTIYRNLNAFMRGDKHVLEAMTKENIEASRNLALKLERAMEKMPNMEGKLVFRGDDWYGYNGNIGEKIEIKSFSSVFNEEKNAFISKDRNILLIIEGKQGRVKDISQLAIGVNFGDKLNGISKVNNEGVILSKSIVKITKKEIEETFINKDKVFINRINMKQIK